MIATGLLGYHHSTKKEILQDCNYCIKKYIVNDNYYELTKKFCTNKVKNYSKKVIKMYFIFFSIWIIMAISVSLLTYFSCIYVHYWLKYYTIYIVISFSIFVISLITLIIWLKKVIFDKLKEYIEVFMQLVKNNCIKSDLLSYPQLIVNVLFIEQYLVDPTYYQFTNVSPPWLLYGFANFYDKLNEYYLDNHVDNKINNLNNSK